MPKQPSTHLPAKAHNRKEDKTSRTTFFKNQVPTGNSLYQKKTHLAERSFSIYSPKLWNNLPNSVKESKSINTFKEKLKTYLFTKAYNLKKCKVPFIMPGIP